MGNLPSKVILAGKMLLILPPVECKSAGLLRDDCFSYPLILWQEVPCKAGPTILRTLQVHVWYFPRTWHEMTGYVSFRVRRESIWKALHICLRQRQVKWQVQWQGQRLQSGMNGHSHWMGWNSSGRCLVSYDNRIFLARTPLISKNALYIEDLYDLFNYSCLSLYLFFFMSLSL